MRRDAVRRDEAVARIRGLGIWRGEPEIERIPGGRTNLNFKVTDRAGAHVVRLGGDIPHHHVLRRNELAAARAAHAAGLSPALRHAEPGLTVFEFIEGRTLEESDIRHRETLGSLVEILHKCHMELPGYLPGYQRGPAPVFRVFDVLRGYAAMLEKAVSPHAGMLPEIRVLIAELEAAAGRFEIVFGHNDLVAANILDDGRRLWLIDWEYAGFNTPLFDLGGLASNNGLGGEEERHMLELYFGRPVGAALFRRYFAMKTAAILREAMWSMVSEFTSTLDVDYAAYTARALARFRAVLSDYRNL